MFRGKEIISRISRFQPPGGQVAAAVENHKLDEVGSGSNKREFLGMYLVPKMLAERPRAAPDG